MDIFTPNNEDTNSDSNITILEINDIHYDKLKSTYDKLKNEYDMLKNELYSKKCEINNLNETLVDIQNKNTLLVENNKDLNYLNEVLLNKSKTHINDYSKLKEKYDTLEYAKLDIEEKYLNQLDKKDCIDYLEIRNEKLEKELLDTITKCNEEKNINKLLSDSLSDMTKHYDKYKSLYNQSIMENNTIKTENQQYKKEYKNLLKKNEHIIDNISKKLQNKLFKKQLYEHIERIFNSEPYVYNEIINNTIKLILNSILLEKLKIN